MSIPSADFRTEYARHRASEGRALRGDELRSLPYLAEGALARQWAVRSRTFDKFANSILKPMSHAGPLDVLDLGAGNGWLCHRLAKSGHRAIAIDIRDDDVDGLGAAVELLADPATQFHRVKASFDLLPFGENRFDLVISF